MSLLLTVIVVALVFEYINGFHDTANSIATVVSTKVLSPRQAVAMAAVKTDPSSALAVTSRRALEEALGHEVRTIVWRFCTDGSICAQHGVPIIGFGPGDQELAHTSQERVSLDQLREAMLGNAALALNPA